MSGCRGEGDEFNHDECPADQRSPVTIHCNEPLHSGPLAERSPVSFLVESAPQPAAAVPVRTSPVTPAHSGHPSTATEEWNPKAAPRNASLASERKPSLVICWHPSHPTFRPPPHPPVSNNLSIGFLHRRTSPRDSPDYSPKQLPSIAALLNRATSRRL